MFHQVGGFQGFLKTLFLRFMSYVKYVQCAIQRLGFQILWSYLVQYETYHCLPAITWTINPWAIEIPLLGLSTVKDVKERLLVPQLQQTTKNRETDSNWFTNIGCRCVRQMIAPEFPGFLKGLTSTVITLIPDKKICIVFGPPLCVLIWTKLRRENRKKTVKTCQKPSICPMFYKICFHFYRHVLKTYVFHSFSSCHKPSWGP